MSFIRRIILAIALIAGLAPAMAQVPPPVPALPDTERRTSYSISGTTCACAVNFALYGDSTDYQNWVEVFVNGVLVNFNDATFGWTITSPSGPIANLARPISNAVLTFNSAQTGTVQIVGARRPRRTSQFNEGVGVPTRNFNVVLSDIIAQNREIWDKTNDFTGRALLGLPGETITALPSAANRAGKFFIWDGSGNPSVTAPSLGTGNVLGPGTSVVNGFARWNNTTGTLLKDSGAQIAVADLPQGIANSIFINPTGSTANMQNLAVPACANDGAHGLVYVNGSGLACATMTNSGTVTSVTCGTGLSGGTFTTTGTCGLALTNATLQATASNPTGTANTTTGVMMGIGTTCHLTPVYSTRIELRIVGSVANSSIASSTVSAKFGTGTAPANAAVTTGTSVGSGQIAGSAGANASVPFNIGGLITGLTPGTAYWFDIAMLVSSGTGTINSPSCSAMEL